MICTCSYCRPKIVTSADEWFRYALAFERNGKHETAAAYLDLAIQAEAEQAVRS